MRDMKCYKVLQMLQLCYITPIFESAKLLYEPSEFFVLLPSAIFAVRLACNKRALTNPLIDRLC